MTDHWLHGTWRLMRADPALGFQPGTRMEFLPESRLRYHIPVDGQTVLVDLVWRLDGDLLHTDVVGSPNARTVRVLHGAGDLLLLDFAGPRAMLVREDGPYIQNS